MFYDRLIATTDRSALGLPQVRNKIREKKRSQPGVGVEIWTRDEGLSKQGRKRPKDYESIMLGTEMWQMDAKGKIAVKGNYCVAKTIPTSLDGGSDTARI